MAINSQIKGLKNMHTDSGSSPEVKWNFLWDIHNIFVKGS